MLTISKIKALKEKSMEAKDGDVIKKSEGFSEKLERLRRETKSSAKKSPVRKKTSHYRWIF